MDSSRRRFLKATGACALGALLPSAGAAAAPEPSGAAMGVLVDIPLCIGCRKCEWACNEVNNLTDKPLTSFEDFSVFEKQRRMEHDSFTVVNRYDNEQDPEKPLYVKFQCMHCLRPACASACPVSALERTEKGSVVYDSWRCMGCRYCMIACPFGVPAYEYHRALLPRVRKCTFCFDRVENQGRLPGCVEICPVEVMTYAKRSDLIALAHEKIEANPEKYIDHLYGENEVGGTAWMYLAPKAFERIGFLELGDEPIPAMTEALQSGLFKYALPPVALFGLLGAAMKFLKDPDEKEAQGDASNPQGLRKVL